ncbi:MAG: AI-2E family transporter, partial [Thermoguttaceae bacterium]
RPKRLASVQGTVAALREVAEKHGCLPAQVALAWVTQRRPGTVVAIPGALQMLIGNVIEPKLLGRGLELHPVTVLLVLAFWGLLWGYMGMVLAVPITAILRIVLMRFETTKTMGDLLGGHFPENSIPSQLDGT